MSSDNARALARTVTLRKETPDPAIVGLKALGRRHPIGLARFCAMVIRLGRGRDNHIRVADKYVSRSQCFLIRRGATWMVTPHKDAKNPTYVNGVAITGDTLLHVGNFLSCGSSIWLCVAKNDRADEWRIGASNHARFLQTALLAYGSGYAAGEGVGVHPNTFRRRVNADEQGTDIAGLCARARTRSTMGEPIIGAAIKPAVVLEPLKLYAAYESQ